MSQDANALRKTGDAQDQALESEVTTVLRILDNDRAASEGGWLDHHFALRAVYDRDVWRQVITVLAQR